MKVLCDSNSSVLGLDLPYGYCIQTYTPTYLKPFGYFENIDFIYKKSIQCEDTPIKLHKYSKSDEELDLTGSPLKLALADESFNVMVQNEVLVSNLWLPIEETHTPITLQSKREVMNNYLWSGKKQVKDRWFWFLVEQDCNKIVLHGQCVKPENWWSTATVRIKEPSLYMNIDLNTFMSQHMKTYKVNLKQTSVAISSLYDLANQNNSVDLELSTNIMQNNIQNIALEISWNELTMRPSMFSKTILKQEFTIGNISPANNLWEELCIIQNLYEIIIKNRDTLVQSLYNIDMPCICEDHKPLIDEVQKALHYSEDKKEDFVCTNIDSGLKMTAVRPTAHFCDTLWSILKGSSTYMELVNCLNLVFEEAAHGNLAIKLPEENNTRLSSLLQDVLSHRAAIPCLTGLQPIELLLEVGVEKLCKDYIYLFEICKFAGNPLPFYEIPDDKTPVVNVMNVIPRLTMHPGALRNSAGMKKDESNVQMFQNSRFNVHEYNHKFQILARAHIIVEYLLLAESGLQFELGTLNDLCTKVYDTVMLEKNPNYKPPTSLRELIKNQFQSINIPIDTKFIKSTINGKYPNSFCVTIRSERKFSIITDTYYFNTKCIFPPSIYEPEASSIKINSDGYLYFAVQYTEKCNKIGK